MVTRRRRAGEENNHEKSAKGVGFCAQNIISKVDGCPGTGVPQLGKRGNHEPSAAFPDVARCVRPAARRRRCLDDLPEGRRPAAADVSERRTATAGSDYTSASGTLTWLTSEAGQTKSFTVTLLTDSDSEPTETVILTLSNAANATITPQVTAVLNIIDDDETCPEE